MSQYAVSEPRGVQTMARAVGSEMDKRLRGVLEGHLDLAGRTLRSFGVSEADVDDGIQQVCLVLADKLGRIEPGSERAFVFRTAQRIASRIRRTRVRRQEVPEQEATDLKAPLDPEQLADQREAIGLLSRILDSLDDELREVFVLYEVEGLTMGAIADILELPPGTVASRLRRAREQFHTRAKARFPSYRGEP